MTDQQWALVGGTLRHVPGGVDEYLHLAGQLNASGNARPQAPGFTGAAAASTSVAGAAGSGASGEAAKGSGVSGSPTAPSLSNAERQRLKKEVASLDRKMETRRAKIDELKAALFDIDPTDFAALTAQQEAIAAAQEELEELEMAWLEASEQLEG